MLFNVQTQEVCTTADYDGICCDTCHAEDIMKMLDDLRYKFVNHKKSVQN